MKNTETNSEVALSNNPSVMQVAFKSCCPKCGNGRLYQSILKPATNCKNCNLDYSFIDSGDGPAVFVILIIGFFVTALAMSLQSALAPPIWVHMLLWVPLILGLSIWGLQFSKSIMIALQYQTKAEQGALDTSNET